MTGTEQRPRRRGASRNSTRRTGRSRRLTDSDRWVVTAQVQGGEGVRWVQMSYGRQAPDEELRDLLEGRQPAG